MTSPAKRKGDRAEREVVAVLRKAGIPADRAYGAGRRPDPGDIDGLPGRYVQVRWRRELRPHTWWTKTVEAAAALDLEPVLVMGLPGLPPETWIVWAVTRRRWRLEDWAEAVARAT
ncbi:MAG: hypothetical protein M0Z46_20070 [Actinomycetota bacterium]|jgi:hypothetical protein|nr:hypothetical protein [Actinomycetota bacterium]